MQKEVKVGAGRSCALCLLQGRGEHSDVGPEKAGLGLDATRTNTRQQGLRSPDDKQ